MKYAVRWSMMDRFSMPDLWAVRGVKPPVWGEKPSVVNPHESESRVMDWGESHEDINISREMANHQGYLSPYMTNSLAIRQEIQRFESVHPSIYAIYDLIELVPDPLLAQQIREHVVCIEGRIQILHICVAKMASEERYWSFLGDNLSGRFLPPWVLGIETSLLNHFCSRQKMNYFHMTSLEWRSAKDHFSAFDLLLSQFWMVRRDQIQMPLFPLPDSTFRQTSICHHEWLSSLPRLSLIFWK